MRPSLLDEDLLGPVDHDVGDFLILEEELEWAEAECLVKNLVDQALALVAVEQRVLGIAKMFDDAADFTPQGVRVHLIDAVHVEPIDQPHVNVALEGLVLLDGRVDFSGSFTEPGSGWGRRRYRRWRRQRCLRRRRGWEPGNRRGAAG